MGRARACRARRRGAEERDGGSYLHGANGASIRNSLELARRDTSIVAERLTMKAVGEARYQVRCTVQRFPLRLAEESMTRPGPAQVTV